MFNTSHNTLVTLKHAFYNEHYSDKFTGTLEYRDL